MTRWKRMGLPILALIAVGCQSVPGAGDAASAGSGERGQTSGDGGGGGRAGAPPGGAGEIPGGAGVTFGVGRAEETSGGRPLAYINGRALTGDQLLGPLIEASGGLTLADLVLDAQVRARLDAAGQMVTTAQAQAEKAMILETLAQDEDTAARLLVELRRSRGLGDERFEALLYRNAGLRGLVGDQAEATEAALKQAYLMRYGPKYRVRLIVTRTMDEAAALRRRAQAGEAFADLAAAHSIDPSAAQGGLLSPISPLDPNYPAAVRNVLPGLDRDPLSPVVVLETGFALVRLEDIIEPQPVEFDQVRDDLAVVVLRRNQRLLMAQLAREMLVDAEVIVLDPALKRSWDDHRRRLIEP